MTSRICLLLTKGICNLPITLPTNLPSEAARSIANNLYIVNKTYGLNCFTSLAIEKVLVNHLKNVVYHFKNVTFDTYLFVCKRAMVKSLHGGGLIPIDLDKA